MMHFFISFYNFSTHIKINLFFFCEKNCFCSFFGKKIYCLNHETLSWGLRKKNVILVGGLGQKRSAIISLVEDAPPVVYLFGPSQAWNYLAIRYRSENLWLNRNHHGQEFKRSYTVIYGMKVKLSKNKYK